MAATYLQLKNLVANVSGRTNGGTPIPLRDNAINYVYQYEITNAYPFSWTKRTVQLTTDSNGEVDLPANYNPVHKIPDIRHTEPEKYDDVIFREVNEELFDSMYQGQAAYYISYNTSTDRYRLVTTEPDYAINVTYHFVPPELVGDGDICIVPDPDVVGYLAAARYWLASERDEANHDRFKALGQQRLGLLIQRDKKSNPQRIKRGTVYSRNLGWNAPGDNGG